MADQTGVLCNITELAKLTGRARETCKKLMEGLESHQDGQSKRYDSHLALPRIYEIGGQGEGYYNLNVERARLSHHQANITSLKEQVETGSLIPAEEVDKNWEGMTMNWKARVLGIPANVVHELSQTNDMHEIMEILKHAINDTFLELIQEENDSNKELATQDN